VFFAARDTIDWWWPIGLALGVAGIGVFAWLSGRAFIRRINAAAQCGGIRGNVVVTPAPATLSIRAFPPTISIRAVGVGIRVEPLRETETMLTFKTTLRNRTNPISWSYHDGRQIKAIRLVEPPGLIWKKTDLPVLFPFSGKDGSRGTIIFHEIVGNTAYIEGVNIGSGLEDDGLEVMLTFYYEELSRKVTVN
jgi:hypothetical protein